MTITHSPEGWGSSLPAPNCLSVHSGPFCIPQHCPFKRCDSFLSTGGSGHTAQSAKVVGYKSTLALLGSGLSSELPRWRAGLGLQGQPGTQEGGDGQGNWAQGPNDSCPPLSKSLGPEKMPKSFYASHKDFLTPELQAGIGLWDHCPYPCQ